MQKQILLLDQADFIGGAELFNLDLINHLDTEKFEINLLFSGNPDYQKKIKRCIKEYTYSLPKIKNGILKYWNLVKSVWLIRTIVKREKIELIQSNTIRTHVIVALAKKIFKLDVKLVWFVHDFTFPQKTLRKLIKIPELILTCSKTVKKDLIQKTNIQFSEKIQVVYNGVKIKKIKPENKNSKVLHNILKTGITHNILKKYKIGIIGRLDPWKGQDIFIQAATEVLKKNKKVVFYIIGSSSEYDQKTLKFEKKLRKLVKDLKLENKIKFWGHVENLEKEFRNLDIIVHASKKTEPFGRVIIEAMNFGKIVVATNLGGPQEIIENAKDGYLIEANNPELLAEKILTIMQKTNSTIPQNALQKIKNKFELKKQIRKIEKYWEKLLFF